MARKTRVSGSSGQTPPWSTPLGKKPQSGDRLDEYATMPNLRSLLEFLLNPNKMQTYHVMKRSILIHLEWKRARYSDLAGPARESLDREVQRVRSSSVQWKRWAGLGSDADKDWEVFEKLADSLGVLEESSRVIQGLLEETDQRLKTSMWDPNNMIKDVTKKNFEALRTRMVDAVYRLSTFHVHAELVDSVCELVLCFYYEPAVVRKKFMNFMLVGNPGTGKTTIAKEIGEVLSASGIFLHSQVLEASRNDFVGQYLGETTPRTTATFLRGLDSGVIFIDEAYALTQPGDRYGEEFSAALVYLMTKYLGLYCVVVAGYKDNMLNDFLKSNEGLDRRIPYKFELADISTETLMITFKNRLAELQGISGTNRDAGGPLEAAERFFTEDAYDYLRRVLVVVRELTVYEDSLKSLVRDQIGSATLHADSASTYLASSKSSVRETADPSNDPIKVSEGWYYRSYKQDVGAYDHPLGVEDMRAILRRHLKRSTLSEAAWERLDDLMRDAVSRALF